MKVIPAIDLMDGKVVRLYQGQFDAMTIYHDDPFEMARRLMEMGASQIHIVDLDAARQRKSNNREVIKRMAGSSEINVPLQVGGGVNSLKVAGELLSAGVERIVVGSLLFSDEDVFHDLIKSVGEKVVLALDIKEDIIRTDGWRNKTGIRIADVVKQDWIHKLHAVMVTDISVDGSLCGPNLLLMRALKEAYPLRWIASGGVNRYEDLLALNQIGVYGTILGKSIYEGLILNLKDIEVK